jgi:hypothetical protein
VSGLEIAGLSAAVLPGRLAVNPCIGWLWAGLDGSAGWSGWLAAVLMGQGAGLARFRWSCWLVVVSVLASGQVTSRAGLPAWACSLWFGWLRLVWLVGSLAWVASVGLVGWLLWCKLRAGRSGRVVACLPGVLQASGPAGLERALL